MSRNQNLLNNNREIMGDLHLWSEDSKIIMEFSNLLFTLYGTKYGVRPDWFSTDPWFNDQIDIYNA